MSPQHRRFLALLFFAFFFISNAKAVTLNSLQTDYVTTGNITTSGVGINSALIGTSSSPDKIKNTFIITTGNFGATASAYGIKVTGNYNQITNDVGAQINTTGSSGRGISVAGLSTVVNLGSISTQSTSSYGIYLGGDGNSANNSGSISTANTSSYGINSDGNNNVINNSGNIITAKTHGIYVSAASASVASPTVFNTVNNSGSVTAFANGIYAKDNYTQITNSGKVDSGVDSDDYGIVTEGSNSIINNSGTINSARYAIFNSGDDAIINNSGTLNGGVRTGNGVLNIFGGAINGEVFGSSGSGTINIGDVSHLGVVFNQTHDFLEIGALNITSGGTLNSNLKIDANQITLDENSTLNVSAGFSTTALIKGASDSNGTLTISGIGFSPNAIGASGYSLKNLNIAQNSVLVAVSDIYASNVFVNGGLNLSATNNLTIFGSLSGSGSAIINVGNYNQTIAGNFSLLSGDIFVTSLRNNAVGGFTVAGLANISGSAKLEINTAGNQGYIASGSKFLLVSGAGGSSINKVVDENISLNGSGSNIYGLLRVTSSATATGLYINIDHLKAEEVTANKNAQNIYRTLDSSGSSSEGKMLDFQVYLDNSGFSGDEITQALNQLAPQSTKASLATTRDLANNSISIIETKLHNFLERIWVQPFIISTAQNTVKDDEGYNANSRGLAFGASKEIGDNASVGASLSIARSDVKSTNNFQQNAINSYQLNFYARRNFAEYFLEGIAGAAINKYNSNRSITALGINAKAGYFGQTYVAKSRIGVTKKLRQGFEITPDLSFNFLRNDIAGYSEKGAETLNLNVQKVSANFFEGRAGINLGWSGKFYELPEFEKFAITTKISYGQAFINDAPTTTARFSGQSSTFDSTISQLDNNSLKVGFLFDAFHKQATTFSLNYNFEHRATYQSHLFAAKIRQEF